MSVITFTVPLPATGLRRNSETRNVRYRSALKRQFQEDVWVAGAAEFARRWPVFVGQQGARRVNNEVHGMPWVWANVHYIWYSTHETDADNIIATMKPALDVLKATGPRPLGIIADDGPGIGVTAEWKKAAKRTLQGVTIRIERRDAE